VIQTEEAGQKLIESILEASRDFLGRPGFGTKICHLC